jgi:hypothetical protein
MGSIYEDSFLTIAATDGQDRNHRPLHEYCNTFVDNFVVSMPCDPANASNGLFFFGPRKMVEQKKTGSTHPHSTSAHG